MSYQAPTTGLHSPTLLPFLQNFAILVSYAGTILEVWSELLLHRLDLPHGLHLSAVPQTFGHVQRSPLLPNLLKKGGN